MQSVPQCCSRLFLFYLKMVLIQLIISALFIGVVTAQYDCKYDTKFPMQMPGECGNFFVCYKGDRLEYICRQSLGFNSYTKQCAPKEDVLCLPPQITARQMCRQNDSSTFQADPESCSHYTNCIDGFNYQLKCADGLFFNEDIGACDLAGNVKCSGKSTTFASSSAGVPNATLCPPGSNNAFQAHPENCTKYFNCISDLYYEYDCPSGSHFNSTSKSCDTVESASCTISTPNLDCPEGSPSHPQAESEDCAGFYICYNGNKLNYTCHEDYIFNNETLLCDIYSPGGVCLEEDRCKGQENYVRLPHETDCGSYYKCLDGVSIEMKCVSDLHFNSVTKRCERPEDANCNLGDTTADTTTTEEPTTTTEEITTTTTEEITTTEVPSPCADVADYDRAPHEDNCRSFYICFDNEVAYEGQCPVPFVFDSRSKQCVQVSDSDCQTVTCEEFQKYPDSESCSRYYQCMNNTFLAAACPDPLHYNVRRSSCDDKVKAGCLTKDV